MNWKKIQSEDGTVKYLFTTSDKQNIESVFIPQKTTNTICLSSQIGCALACTFCATGALGFARNLRSEEIIEQYEVIVKDQNIKKLPNIVFMGMGEPLLNLNNVKTAVVYFNKKGLSKKSMTISTVGIIEQFQNAAKLGTSFALSLHSATDTLREKIMPINKKYKIQNILEACAVFQFTKHKPLMIEYILLGEINDQEKHIQDLIILLKKYPYPYLINLIPYNAHRFASYTPSKRAQQCKQQLIQAGFKTFIRESRGEDISGACGMLAGNLSLLSSSRRQKSTNSEQSR